jgi:hypothetical protein
MPDDEILGAASRAVELSHEGLGMPGREKWGLRPSSFGRKFSDTTGVDPRTPGAYEESNRRFLASAKELITEEDVEALQVRPAHQLPQDPAEKSTTTAWAEAESNLFNSAQSGTAGLWKSHKEKLEEYRTAARENTARAEEAAKTAKQEARWQAQDERETKVKEWLEGKSEDQINQLVASKQFSELSDLAQNRVFVALEELGYSAQAEVDLNLEQLEEAEAEQQFQIAAPMPWEERPQPAYDEDQGEDDEEDDGVAIAYR